MYPDRLINVFPVPIAPTEISTPQIEYIKRKVKPITINTSISFNPMSITP